MQSQSMSMSMFDQSVIGGGGGANQSMFTDINANKLIPSAGDLLSRQDTDRT